MTKLWQIKKTDVGAALSNLLTKKKMERT